MGRYAVNLMVWMALLLVAALFVMPLVWMIATSVKPEVQAASQEIALLPSPPSILPQQAKDNYTTVWNDSTVQFPLYLRNTLIVAVLSVAGMTLSSAVVAYGLSRVRWKGRGAAFGIILATMMIPFPVLMVPLFVIFRELGWNGTLSPLWIPAWFGGAYNIFMLRQFFLGIPRELDEAARIDGMGHLGIFWRVILPLSRPALVVVALFHFVYVWNDFLQPLIFLHHRDTYTLALGLQLYQSQAGQTPWNLLMAASTMVVLPVLLVFVISQGSLVKGISGEGLKGT